MLSCSTVGWFTTTCCTDPEDCLLSGLWNSATAWSAEAFNTTVCGRCSRYDLRHHCVVLVPCVSFARCFTFTCSAVYASLSGLLSSATAWSAEVFHPLCDTLSRRGSRDRTSSTTVRYLSFVSLFAPCVKCSTWAVSFLCTAARWPSTHAVEFCEYSSSSEGCSLRRRLSAEYCETSCERLICGIPTSAECFEAPPPHLRCINCC